MTNDTPNSTDPSGLYGTGLVGPVMPDPAAYTAAMQQAQQQQAPPDKKKDQKEPKPIDCGTPQQKERGKIEVITIIPPPKKGGDRIVIYCYKGDHMFAVVYPHVQDKPPFLVGRCFQPHGINLWVPEYNNKGEVTRFWWYNSGASDSQTRGWVIEQLTDDLKEMKGKDLSTDAQIEKYLATIKKYEMKKPPFIKPDTTTIFDYPNGTIWPAGRPKDQIPPEPPIPMQNNP